MNALLAEHHKRLLEAQIAAVALSTAYRLHEPRTVKPKEVAPASFLEALDRAESRHGTKLVKFFNSTGEE